MKKIKYLIVYIMCIFILFTNCTRNTNSKQVHNEIDNDSSQYIPEHDERKLNENIENDSIKNEEIQFVNENYFTLLEIRNFISSDVNITKSSFDSINEILIFYNISENYIIHESTDYYPPADTFFNVYHIEWDVFIIRIHKYDYSDKYFFYNIEITLNQENYLKLFPYINIEKYTNDDNFGRIFSCYYSSDGIRNILYGFTWEYEDSLGEDVPLEICRLIFDNGLLKSIILN